MFEPQFAMDFIPDSVSILVLATVLGLFIGLEREWSEKPAGIRTFAIVSLTGSTLALLENYLLLSIGGVAIIIVSVLLGVEGIIKEEYGLSITTSMSLLLTYFIGVAVGFELLIESVTITALSSALLVLKRELHGFAGELNKEEIKSATELAIIAFVAYQFIPSKPVGPNNSIELQLVWLLVIAISGIGFVNYILVSKYGNKGFLLTGFLGGLVNSTAVIGDVTSRVKNGIHKNIAISSVIIANSAMTLRNALLVIVFIPSIGLILTLPLFTITIIGIVISAIISPTNTDVPIELESPFNLKNTLMFGGLFAVVLFVSSIAKIVFGKTAFLLTIFLAGAVSSGTAVATIITLLNSGEISVITATVGILISVISSMLIKVALVSMTKDKTLIVKTIAYTVVLIISGILTVGILSTLSI